MKIRKLFILTAATLPLSVYADPAQFLPEQSGVENLIEKNYEDFELSGTHVSGTGAELEHSIEKDYVEVESQSPFIDMGTPDNYSKEKNGKDRVYDRGVLPLGATEHYENYVEADYGEINTRLNNKARQAFKFAYLFKDQTEFSNSSDSFNKTFHQGPDRVSTGQIMFGYERYFNRSVVDLFWGFNTGLSFFRGYGKFKSDDSQSEAAINLFAVPVDLALGFNLPLLPWVDASLMGGPSVLGLFQTRSDRANDEKGKRLRQLGTGYFADAQLRFSLSHMIPSSVFKMYSGDSVTKVWLNLEGRYQNYNKFPEEGVKVAGPSYGLSFTFEYL